MAARLLTVQTASPAGSVALSEGDTLRGEISLNVQKTHADWLLNAIDVLLKAAEWDISDLDGFGVVIGPGSFTGLRVGLATVKGLAVANGCSIVGVSSLAALAYQSPFSRWPICAMLDARKKEVYAGLFRWESGQLQTLAEERVIPPEELLKEFDGDAVFVGDGARAYRTLIVRQLAARAHFAPAGTDHLRAGSAAMLAFQHWEAGHRVKPTELIPCYIRPSEAELNWRK